MNWTEPRKSQKSSQQNFSASKKIQTTCLNTPLFDKEYKSGKYEQQPNTSQQIKQKNCPYHFNTQDHVCLTCRKSICVRCAITYCQNHTIKQQKQIIPTLVEDLHKIYIRQSIDQIETKLGQSLQRQDYFQNKILKLIEKVQQNFSMVIETLNKKKLQIISYFDQEFQKYLNEYRQYDQILKQKLIWLNSVEKQWSFSKFEPAFQTQKFTIEKIDEVSAQIKNDSNIVKAEKKLNSIMLGKNKLSMQKLWSEENLQKVLFEIEKIPFRMCKDMVIPQVKTLEKKKRIITESSQHQCKPIISTHKSPMPKNVKGSGRIIYNKFNSGRKNKEERLQKSQLL